MPSETPVTLMLDSASLFRALRQEIGRWELDEHTFRPDIDEIRMFHDSGGSGRVAVTVVFELGREQMTRLLDAARSSR